jgi:hypothetical protein
MAPNPPYFDAFMRAVQQLETFVNMQQLPGSKIRDGSVPSGRAVFVAA